MRQFVLVPGADGGGLDEVASEATGAVRLLGFTALRFEGTLRWVVGGKHEAIRPEEIEGLTQHAVTEYSAGVSAKKLVVTV